VRGARLLFPYPAGWPTARGAGDAAAPRRALGEGTMALGDLKT